MVHVVPLAEGREVGAGVVGRVVGEGPRSSLLLPLPTALACLVGLVMSHGASGRSPGFAVPGHMTGNAANDCTLQAALSLCRSSPDQSAESQG